MYRLPNHAPGENVANCRDLVVSSGKEVAFQAVAISLVSYVRKGKFIRRL